MVLILIGYTALNYIGISNYLYDSYIHMRSIIICINWSFLCSQIYVVHRLIVYTIGKQYDIWQNLELLQSTDTVWRPII